MGRAKPADAPAGDPADGTRLRCLLTGAGKRKGKGKGEAARAAKQPRQEGSQAPKKRAKTVEGTAKAPAASAEASGLVSTEAAPPEAPAGTAKVYPSGLALQCAACDYSFVRWNRGDVCDCGLMLCYDCADSCGCKEEDKHRRREAEDAKEQKELRRR